MEIVFVFSTRRLDQFWVCKQEKCRLNSLIYNGAYMIWCMRVRSHLRLRYTRVYIGRRFSPAAGLRGRNVMQPHSLLFKVTPWALVRSLDFCCSFHPRDIHVSQANESHQLLIHYILYDASFQALDLTIYIVGCRNMFYFDWKTACEKDDEKRTLRE